MKYFYCHILGRIQGIIKRTENAGYHLSTMKPVESKIRLQGFAEV